MKVIERIKKRTRILMSGDCFAHTTMISRITKGGRALSTEGGSTLRRGWFTSPRTKD